MSLMLYLYEMMNVYYDNHFMMYVSQIIMLYTLNLFSAICRPYLNKTGRKQKQKKKNK